MVPGSSLANIEIPDLLHEQAHSGVDHQALLEVLGLAFLGRELGTQIHDALARATVPDSQWQPGLFASDIFLRRLIESSFTLQIGGRRYPVNHDFLFRSLAHAPTDLATIAMRQGVLRELDADEILRERTYALYREIFDLLSLMKTPGYHGAIELAAFHLDIFRQAKLVIDFMDESFAGAASALRRLHDSASAWRESEEYRTLVDLLELESSLARLGLQVTVGGDGRLRELTVHRVEEPSRNRFYRRPLRRLLDRWRLLYRGYPMSNRELMDRLVNDVFRQVSPALVPLVQVLGHLEVYLTARSFRDRATSLGLETSLASFDEGAPLRLERLFNPLLLDQARPPVPCTIESRGTAPITLVTGPNSGGKTRLLQSIALAQLLGQSGLYAPCGAARLRVENGLFVSLVEEEGASQTEGRLGRELVRIRSLFEEMSRGSMVILDELCSGTNPSEGTEVFAMVLRLLRRVEPRAFATTHFLDFARTLRDQGAIHGLEFLQVEVDARLESTYQFEPGVAETSLAALTAERLGVTFERLAAKLEDREAGPG
ncbi:MAG TPA: DNA mismatch repair protein [Thermoanaerobaculia bacterium]|nr:DNA mismatch repair protein [Thermoanaerobaculia bacterium]